MKKIIVIFVVLLFAAFVIATDIDGDGVEDDVDNCYNYYNPGQEDSNTDGVGDACDIEEYMLPLKEGWNLVSFPLNYGLITAASLNETFDGALDSIFAYYRNDSFEGWQYYIEEFPQQFNSLNAFDPSYGFWLNMKGDVNLTLRAPKIYQATQKVYQGWNLLSYPWLESGYLEDVFGSELDYIVAMYVYDAWSPDGWQSWISFRPPELDDFNATAAGYGAWIEMSEDRDWEFDSGIIS